jgi:hypothetical protein
MELKSVEVLLKEEESKKWREALESYAKTRDDRERSDSYVKLFLEASSVVAANRCANSRTHFYDALKLTEDHLGPLSNDQLVVLSGVLQGIGRAAYDVAFNGRRP